MRRATLCLAQAACLVASTQAFAAAPTLTQVFPAGAQRGSTVVVTCQGDFAWPVALWAPGVSAIPGKEAGQVELTVPADLPADRIWLRLYNSEGASTSMPLLIGGLREVVEQEPNNSARAAQVLQESPVTVNGLLKENGDVDAFAISLQAWQTLVVALDANTRLGAPMDAILQVVTPEGTVLAENHDEVGLDPRLAFTPRRAGTYVVRVFAFPATPDTSIQFRGGTNYVYRLTLTTGGFLEHTRPMTLAMRDQGQVELFGRNLLTHPRQTVAAWDDHVLEGHREREANTDGRLVADTQWGLVHAEGLAGAVRVRRVAELQAIEPTSDPQAGPLLKLDSVLFDWLREPRGAKEYRVALKANQPIVVLVESPGLHLDLVPRVELLDSEGKIVVESAASENPQDALVRFTAPADGVYRIRVRDRFRKASDRHGFQLTVRAEHSDFALALPAETLVVPHDKPVECVVGVTRRNGPEGAIGAIRVEAVGLPAGLQAEAVVSEPAGETADKVTLRISSDGRPFSGPIRIRGTLVPTDAQAGSPPGTLERRALTPPRLNASFDSIWVTALRKP